MELTLWTGIAVFAIGFVSFFIKGLAGFGDPLISSPLLSMFLDSRYISPTNLLLATPINAIISYKNRKHFSVKKILPVVLCILCGVIPGTILLKYATSWVLKAFLGVLILCIGVEMITRNRSKPTEGNPILMAIVCFCSGVTAGLYGINLFFVAYMERTTKRREEFRGNICFVFFLENAFRTVVYLVGGIITKGVLLLGLISLPGMILGFLAGSRVDSKLGDKAIRNIVIAMFMLGGLSILIKAVVWQV